MRFLSGVLGDDDAAADDAGNANDADYDDIDDATDDEINHDKDDEKYHNDEDTDNAVYAHDDGDVD